MSTPQRKPLSREVIVLGWVSFFNDIMSEREVTALVTTMELP